jgi:hypothetical protein
MREPSTFVGLDVHKKDIVVAMLTPDTRDAVDWRIAHEPTSVRRMARRLQREGGSAIHCVI